MTKKTEFIPFMGVVEIDDEEETVGVDRDLYSKTQQEVADELGVSRIAVGQTERRALKKAKELLTKKFKKSDLI